MPPPLVTPHPIRYRSKKSQVTTGSPMGILIPHTHTYLIPPTPYLIPHTSTPYLYPIPSTLLIPHTSYPLSYTSYLYLSKCLTLTDIGITVRSMRNSRQHHYSMNTTTHNIKRIALTKRIALIVIASLLFVPTARLAGRIIDSAYDYKCPILTVTVKQGDTLSSITEAHCEGNTLQASWDIADNIGSTLIQIGDLVQLGDNR